MASELMHGNIQDLILLLIFLIVAFLAYALYTKQTGAAVATGGIIVILIFALIFSQRDDVKSIKASVSGMSFEAEMRELKQVKQDARQATEDAKETVVEAKATLIQVQKLATQTVGSVLDGVQMAGRLNGYSEHDKEMLKVKLLSSLDELNISKEEQRKMLEKHWDRYIFKDYTFMINDGTHLIKDLSPESRKELHELTEGGMTHIPSPNEMQTVLERANALTEKRKELLEDYRYYIQHHKHRRPSVWNNRYN